MSQFFYDEQLRRFLLQFARIFSNFDVEFGTNEAGQGPGSSVDTLIRVPVRYGDASRQAQTILQNNSASSMPSTPLMTFYITDLKYDRPRIQEPNFVSNIQVRQRTYDTNTDTYETTQGNAFTIERLMPVPYEMTINLDIWTSNTNQKMQLLEQILTLFNPSLEIQSTDNYIDWTSLTVLYLKDTRWSSRTIPMNTENPIDIATLTFTLPMWITPPAKVKKLGVVERIIASVYDANGDLNNALTNSDLLLGTRQKFTPFGYQVLLIDNKLQALRVNQVVDEPNASLNPPDSPSSNLLWHNVVNMYGALRPGISYISLEQPDGTDVIGTVAYDPTDDRFLLFTVNTGTVPPNTLLPIAAVINPLTSGPDAGLPAPVTGQRYLLTQATGSFDNPGLTNPAAWLGVGGEPLVAYANDIVEYNGTYWEVVFDSTSSPNNLQYVTNLTTELQYRWTGTTWVKSYQGLYPGGSWSLVL
jgi:T4-like virus Myoviridae tail sheath stabiliser